MIRCDASKRIFWAYTAEVHDCVTIGRSVPHDHYLVSLDLPYCLLLLFCRSQRAQIPKRTQVVGQPNEVMSKCR